MEKIVIITSISNIACFLIGAYAMSTNNKEIKAINPVRVVKEHIEMKRAQRELDKEAEKEKIINENIDSYNGTSLGQKDIPR